MAGQRNATVYWKQELEEAHVKKKNSPSIRNLRFGSYTGKNSGVVAPKFRIKKASNLEPKSSASSK